jgi:hypothetical protein
MKSVVELDINRKQPDVARLFSNPANNPKWMDDIARIEPVRGSLGAPGSAYRLVPKRGKRVFVATVVAREPSEVRLSLEAPGVTVAVKTELRKLAKDKTKLISEEHFTFTGTFNKLFGALARPAIKRAHRRHMESFKHFAEGKR